jgi:hypothetical protein
MNKRNKKQKRTFQLHNKKWVIIITIWTFFLATGLSFFSEIILRHVNLLVAFVIFFLIIWIGILFDLIGISVASAKEKPLHSMAANKVKGAVFAVKLVKNAGPVANFCNDVIGDICGIISGSAGAIIVVQISQIKNTNLLISSILVSSITAAITVGGKAVAKEIALRKSKEIVFYVGKVLYYIYDKTGIDFLPSKKKRKKTIINQKER